MDAFTKMQMGRGFLAGLMLLLLVTTPFGQDAPIKIDTRLVSVPVIVSDRSGRYIPNLTASDFTVLQDGVRQTIDFFAAVEEPLTVAILIDTSQSTRPVLGNIKDSASSFIRHLSPQDRAMIVAFDYDIHGLSRLTSDQDELRRAIKRAEIPDSMFRTRLRDAVFHVVNHSFADIKGRKAIIILTDGKDVGSRISGSDLLYSLQETDTLIYTIMFKTFERVPIRIPGIYGSIPAHVRKEITRRNERLERLNSQAQSFLKDLSNVSAGRFFVSNDGRFKNTFQSIVEELRFQYRLGFYPPDEKATDIYHSLKVRVSRPDSVVRSRSGYRTSK